MASVLNMTRGHIARTAITAAPVILLLEMGSTARHLDVENIPSLIFASLVMTIPTWIGIIISAYARSSSVRDIATIATGVTFLLSLWVVYDITTSDSSTAGIGFVFFPVIASIILGVVIGIGACLAYLDDKRWS